MKWDPETETGGVGGIVDEDRELFEGVVRGCLGCAVSGHWVEGNTCMVCCEGIYLEPRDGLHTFCL